MCAILYFLSEFTCLKKWTVPLSNFFPKKIRTDFSNRTFVPYSYAYVADTLGTLGDSFSKGFEDRWLRFHRQQQKLV